MGMLVNIDNGGTLTDICVLQGDNCYKTKTLTTPYDLSKCFFDGLRAISTVVYGEEDVARLLSEVDRIRYSTTHGTNAICERKGPKLGLVTNKGNRDLVARMRAYDQDLFDVLVGDRYMEVDLDDLQDPSTGPDATTVITRLTSAGANRIVVCFDTDHVEDFETQFKNFAFDTYPRHLLGAVPMLFASDLIDDVSADRRAWTALINSFLHPAMESFLYNAENRLRGYRTKNPLLIFRNDGDASRVAKTIAVKTYSSGPRGGMEGVRAFGKQYNLVNVLSMDVGGTTTDIGHVLEHHVGELRRGEVEGVPISFGLCEIASVGVGGSSILAVDDGELQVGPESVGALPGPACFGRGGKNATITDVTLLMGLLDPATYFGGALVLDIERARGAIADTIATPLNISVEEALNQLYDAYTKKIANELKTSSSVGPETALMAFGGAGPMVACAVADMAGISTVYIPKMAAVFSAFGMGSCDIGQRYAVVLSDHSQAGLDEAYKNLLEKAERDMFAEGFEPGDYTTSAQLVGETSGSEVLHQLNEAISLPQALESADAITLEFSAKKILRTEEDKTVQVEKLGSATSSKSRSVFGENQQWQDIPVYEVSSLQPGEFAMGPAIIEEEYFTCLVRKDWEFVVTSAGDIRLTKGE